MAASAPITEKITFRGSFGHELAASLERPPGEPRAYALFAHCFACSEDSAAAASISRSLAAHDIAVLRFDFTGLGSSGGDAASTDFSSNVRDLVLAADWLRDHRRAPSIVIGHSLGGAAVLAGAREMPEATAVATIAAPSELEPLRRLLGERAVETGERGSAEVTIEARSFRVQRELLDDLTDAALLDRLSGLGKALLVLHSPLDAVVPIAEAHRIFEAAAYPKSFVSLDGADHLLTRGEDADYAASIVATWSARYLARCEEQTEAAAARERTPPRHAVVVRELGEGTFRQEVIVGRHHLVADEPRAYGGDDAGPSPYDLLVAALGTCTAMTIRLYADRKKIALRRVEVALDHAKIHAEDCASCETKEGRIDRIERIVTLDGDLDDADRRRLLAIADRCPVHRTLTSEVEIRTRLAEDASS